MLRVAALFETGDRAPATTARAARKPSAPDPDLHRDDDFPRPKARQFGRVEPQQTDGQFGMTTPGTPLTDLARRVMLLGSGELGEEVVIELQR
jgi:hypothetical protein